jgi:MFS superfamily sulfate permease-like transporter
VGIMAASGIAAVFQLPVQFVSVPENLLETVSLPHAGMLNIFTSPTIWISALALAFIASAETLLSAAAVDRLQTLYRTNYDRELSAQGLGNMLCGLLGALPMTGVIVRSSTNVQAGATSRKSTILHGIYLLAFVMLLPDVLRKIPTSALGAILVFTGYKLVDLKNVERLRSYGRWPVAIYAVTVIGIVCTDLLTGVIAGVILSVIKLVYHVTHLEITTRIEGSRVHMELIGAATFVKLPKLAYALESLSNGSEVHLDIHRVAYIDHACLDLIHSWKQQFETQGGTVIVEWEDVESRFTPIHSSPALVRRLAS